MMLKVFKVLMFMIKFISDLFIMLCVANVIMKTAIELDAPTFLAMGLGMMFALAVLGYMKIRFYMENVGYSPPHLKPIHTEAEYKAVSQEMVKLWNYPAGTPESDRVEVLAILMADYEKYRKPTPTVPAPEFPPPKTNPKNSN